MFWVGVSRDVRIKVDWILLYMVVFEGYVSIVEVLFKYGVDVNVKDMLKMIVFYWVIEYNY